MSTESRSTAPYRVCYHHLVNKCEYGDACYKRHTDISQLTTVQMLNFKKFQNRALEQAKQDVAQPPEPTPVVPAPVVDTLPLESAQQVDNEDEMPSCMLYPQGRCSERNKKCLAHNRHRNLVDFTDEELEKFQRLVTQFYEATTLKK